MVAAGSRVSDDLRRSVERSLLYALSRFGPRVERVAVRLADVTNRLGGVDRRCRMRAWLGRRESVRVETMDGPSAIDRAVGRLAARVEWVLVNGRAETDARLMHAASAASAQVRVPPATRHARPAGRGGGAVPAERKRARR